MGRLVVVAGRSPSALRRGQDARQHDAHREHVLRDRARCPRSGCTVGFHGVERARGLVDAAKEPQSGIRGEMGVGARGLDDARSTAREVADGAVAEPARSRLRVGRLRAADLAARRLHVGPEARGSPRDAGGIDEPPSVPSEELAVGTLSGMEAGRELEARPGSRCKVDAPEPAAALVAVRGRPSQVKVALCDRLPDLRRDPGAVELLHLSQARARQLGHQPPWISRLPEF